MGGLNCKAIDDARLIASSWGLYLIKYINQLGAGSTPKKETKSQRYQSVRSIHVVSAGFAVKYEKAS